MVRDNPRAASQSFNAFPTRYSGTRIAKTSHLTFVLSPKIGHHIFWRRLFARGRRAGMLRCKMVYVQRRIIERQFQRIESVPLAFGPETYRMPSGGSVQFIWK